MVNQGLFQLFSIHKHQQQKKTNKKNLKQSRQPLTLPQSPVSQVGHGRLLQASFVKGLVLWAHAELSRPFCDIQ